MNIELVEVPSELGAGTRGSSLGIEAIKAAARTRESGLFSKYNNSKIACQNELLDHAAENPNAKYIAGILENGKRVSKKVSELLNSGTFPVLLSGDHSIAYGTIAGIKSAFPDKRLGIIWIDAHADLHSPFTSPSGNMHGMPLAMAAGIDNRDCILNEPRPDTRSIWKDIKSLGFESPKFRFEDLVFIGVRSTEKPERYIMEQNNILNITVDELRSGGVEKCIRKTKSYLDQCDIVYVSFDVDSMDPSLSEGTGTSVPDGFNLEEVKALNAGFVSWEKTKAWEMVEINPLLDMQNKMGEMGLEILESVLDSLQ